MYIDGPSSKGYLQPLMLTPTQSREYSRHLQGLQPRVVCRLQREKNLPHFLLVLLSPDPNFVAHIVSGLSYGISSCSAFMIVTLSPPTQG